MSIEVKYYLTDLEGNEFYSKSFNGDELINTNPFYYARLKNGKEIYPRDREGKEKYYFNTYPVFAINQNDELIYAKDSAGDEYYPEYEGRSIYAKKRKGEGIYAIDRHGTQLYPKANGEDVILNDTYAINKKLENYYYPLNKNQEEVAPLGYILDKNDSIIYPKTHSKDEKIPKDRLIKYVPPRNSFVSKMQQDEILFPDRGNPSTGAIQVTRYDRNADGGEIYPIVLKGTHPTEEILEDKYALDKDKNPYYPVDHNGNEYLIDWDGQLDEKHVFPAGYPITHDGYIILPEVEGDFYISQDIKPIVPPSYVVGWLKRPGFGYRDYLTRVKGYRSPRTPKFETLKATFIFSQPVDTSSWWIVIISFIITLAVLFVYSFFIRRHHVSTWS